MNKKTLKNIFATGTKKLAILVFALAIVLGAQAFAQTTAEEQQAAYLAARGDQPCVPGQTPGNIYGFLTTETIGNIYLSTESWNDNESLQTSVEFYVTYDRQTNTWGGRGWNALVGWVDFGQMNPENTGNRTAEFATVKADRIAGTFYYGNWNELITGLGTVIYREDPGQFVGTAQNERRTINGSSGSIDVLVGAGEIGFENVEYQSELTGCDESVNLFLNGVSILYKPVCPITTPKITWTSTAVRDCETDAGLWQNAGSRNPTNITGENASGPITTGNSPETFRLKCIGTGSGSTVYGSATASCGPVNPCVPNPYTTQCNTWCQLNPTSPICVDRDYCIEHPEDPICTGPLDPTTGIVIPDFREV